MDLDELGSWIIDNHERDVFRLETLDRYFVDSDEADFRAYLAGAPAPDRAAKRGWLDWLAAAAAEGRTWRRVHIVRLPLTDYVRFEAEWCYLDNSAAGEQIRFIDLSETDIDLDYLHLDDYYIVDGRAAVLGYDGEGRFLHARVVDNQPADRSPRYAVERGGAVRPMVAAPPRTSPRPAGCRLTRREDAAL